MEHTSWLILFCFLPLWSATACHRQRDNHVLPVITSTRDTLTVADCKRCLILTDQAEPAIDIVDAGRGGKMIWSWSPYQSNIAPKDQNWFSDPDDAKPVYNLKYLLVNASGGGVALIRIADGKVVFYSYVGKNPHSSELLPDGNIVTASSTDNRLVIFHVDTLQSPDSAYKRIITLPFAHNVVWDNKRQVLWSAAENNLYEFQYNFNCQHPDLILKDSFELPGTEAHDLFPIYGHDSLWFTNTTGVYVINMRTMNVSLAKTDFQNNIKSVSSGPSGWPTIIMRPKISWWSDEVMDIQGNDVFQQGGMRIYKARWFVNNLFSYPANDSMRMCN